MSRRLIKNFNSLVVHPHVPPLLKERFGWPRFRGKGGGLSCRRAHPRQNAVMSQNRGAPAGHGVEKGGISERVYENGQPRFGELAVAAHMIRVRSRIDDVTGRQIGDLSERG